MSSRKVRVGIIRCDTHAFWYAPLFEAPDPTAYRRGHIGCHYYFYRWDDPRRLRFRTAPGMQITRVFDEENRERAEALSSAYGGRPKVCDSFEEVSDDVDLVYIADCNYEGKDHLRFATPGLKKGVPHFVDKPFAFTLKDARAMIALARKHRTAVMCSSLLRWSPFMDRFRARFADVDPLGCVYVPCSCGKSLAGVFHGLSLVQSLMGEGCEWVESMGGELYGVARLHYPRDSEGVEVVVANSSGKSAGRPRCSSNYHHCAFQASAYGGGGSMHSVLVDDYLFPHAGEWIVAMARQMALTKRPVIPYASMLEVMEILEALRLAHRRGRRVYVREVRRKP